MIIKRLVLIVFVSVMPFFIFSQNYKIKGFINDSNKKAIPNSTVIINEVVSNNILSYNISNENGYYEIILKNKVNLDSIWITVRHLSYKTKKVKIPLSNLTKTFILESRIEKLNEVILKSSKRVEIKGDTITYNVNRIKSKKDYSVEDVINRIPGVTISESGKIKYKGKAISHLYINDVDLLEGRYNIATQGIPADAVKSIEILQKHNHERIDIGRTDSDKVAFNLNIKEDQSLVFGSLKSDLGLPFTTGLLEGTPIYLKDKFQDIGSIKLNNFGKSLKENGVSLTPGNGEIENLKLKKSQIINPPNTNGVILSDKFWLDNDSYTITNDALHKLSDSTLLKWNVNYSNELSKIENNSETTFIINNDSSLISNRSISKLRFQRFQAGITQEINKRNFYLKNDTYLRYETNDGLSSNILNQDSINNTYYDKDKSVINQTSIKTVFRKDNILNSGLLFEYQNKSERLNVVPKVFDSFFTNNQGNEGTLQTVNVEKFNIAAFSNYSFNWLKTEWKLQQNFNYKDFNFKSELGQTPNSVTSDFPFSSDFTYSQLSTSSKVNAKWNIGKMRLSWNISADITNLNTQEKNIDNPLKRNETYFFLQPFLSARYKFNSKWNSGINYSVFSSISDFNELYTPFILRNFNSIVQNPDIINISKSQSVNPFISYSNIINSLYLTIRGKWQQTTSDITFMSQLNNNGFLVTEVIERPNLNKSHGLSVDLTKGFLGAFNTDFGYSFNTSENELFFNNEFLNTINKSHLFKFKLSIDNGSWYSVKYDTKLNLSSSQLPNNKLNNSFLFQTGTLDFYTSEKTRFSLGVENVRTSSSNNNTNNNTLFNAGFYYKPTKKIFFRVNLLNIFNTPFFSTTNNRLNTLNISQFSLRPRQLTFGFNYSL